MLGQGVSSQYFDIFHSFIFKPVTQKNDVFLASAWMKRHGVLGGTQLDGPFTDPVFSPIPDTG